MWSVRPFNPRCPAAPDERERAAEAMAARLDATAGRCPTALRVELKRFCGRLPAVVVRTDGTADRLAGRETCAARLPTDAVVARTDGVTDRVTGPE